MFILETWEKWKQSSCCPEIPCSDIEEQRGTSWGRGLVVEHLLDASKFVSNTGENKTIKSQIRKRPKPNRKRNKTNNKQKSENPSTTETHLPINRLNKGPEMQGNLVPEVGWRAKISAFVGLYVLKLKSCCNLWQLRFIGKLLVGPVRHAVVFERIPKCSGEGLLHCMRLVVCGSFPTSVK